MLEDLGDDLKGFDAGSYSQLAAADRASLDVDSEYPFQSLHPGHGSEGFVRLLLAGFAFWHDGLTVLVIRGEYAVETREVEPGPRHHIGLYFSQRLMREVNSGLEFTSTEGLGSRFYFRLPISS